MKTTKLKSIKSLKTKANVLWKEYCYLRDGKECQVRKFFSHIQIFHTDIFQVDHCFTRANKHLFFDTSNGTVVCSACNMAKNYKSKSVDRAINDIVMKREGVDVYERMLEQDQRSDPNLNFSKRFWLEDQIKTLSSMIKEHAKKEIF